ncbi:hypothetical protein KJ365_03330 [Glaciecola sp. XM2]|jgi:hypothetical protein|uniref:hypothetical protein n=1 Tax=Glaciecola sp. XM2 TaxID=1914931 RepID=UPI001BDE8D62|nr:hypothetical protein [Glaciecola sp. XM2]MBT1449900.1 hypothetical protein [Glaciecola sp. XM2]
MNKLINIILSGLLWRRYKFLLVSLLVLIVFIFLSGQLHQDYLSYAQSTDSVSVGWSFAIKWLSWLVAVVVFFALNNWHNNKKQAQVDVKDNNSTLQRILSWKKAHPEEEQNKRERNPSDEQVDRSDDPFAHLREKDKLRTYADIIIDKKPSKPKQ